MGKLTADWYVGRGAVQPTQEEPTVKLDNLTLDAFDNIIEKASLNNQERQAAAIEKADSYSFQVANPWFRQNDANMKIVNKWLESKGIRYSTYPEIAEAAEELAAAGLVSVDDAAYASHLDGNDPQTFRGAITQRDYDSLDGLISNERAASIRMLGTEKQSDEELAFEALPLEQQGQMLRDGLKQHQANVDAEISTQNADSWISLHPEFHDGTANGKRLALQLHLNGFKAPYTIENYELAHRQLLASGDVRQNPAQLRKQEAQAGLDRAEYEVKHSAAFDKTTEDQMYELPLDEVRRRANGNYTGIGF